jgi:hypothetical protein
MTQPFKRIKLDENDLTEFFLLPDNLHNIFAFFTGRDLNIVRSTCRTWHQVSINPYFQEIHCTRMGIPHKMQIIRETSAKWEHGQVELLKEHYFFQNGIKNGKFETYSQSTEVLEATGEYKMGKLNGLYKEWFPKTTQLKYFCYYVNGKYEGEYKRWHSNGTLHVDSIMKQNRTVSKQEYCVDGKEAMRL